MRRAPAWLIVCMSFVLLVSGAYAQRAAPGPQAFYGPHLSVQPGTAEAPEGRAPPPAASEATRQVYAWNAIALQANALDHTPVAPGELRVFGEQVGPPRSARALAIVHLAMFDALNAIAGRYPSYSGLPRAAQRTSAAAAVARAAHDALAALYPSQAPRFDAALQQQLARLPDGAARASGTDLGRRAASAILAMRADDGSQYPDPVVGVDFFPSDAPGKWRPDPVSQSPIALGAYWDEVPPFVVRSSADFRSPPPPALTSDAYTAAFNEVKALGGDGVTTPTRRTREQTIAGIYWAYDGTPRLGTPPRLYNQIALEIAASRTTDALELARLLALVNVALVDTCAALWDTKYHYQFWRPVSAVREADEGTGPTGRGDGNPDTRGDPGWTPLGAPASNLRGPNFTPPFPAYQSGHAGMGSALFQVLRRFYATDAIAFTFVSDEFNGVTRDNRGRVRPRLPRSFDSLSEAEAENARSRIYLGVHWSFDASEGMRVGRRVADYVFRRGLQPPGGAAVNGE
jgi:hypothetical protein